MALNKIVVVVVCIGIFGCISACIRVTDISIDNLSSEGGSVITSKADGIGILHLIVPKTEELEDQVVADLRAQGATKNVRLRLQVRDFLLAVQLYEVLGQGEK